MAFDEIRLPIEVERGASGGPGFLTNISVLNSGKEQRNSLWAVDRGQWDIGFGIQNRADTLIIRDFFYARLGRARGFRFRDWTNYQALVEQPTTPESDNVETDFQMYYDYSDAAGFTYTKQIFKPTTEDLVVYVDGVIESPSNYSLDTTTGIITFTSAPAYGSDVTWTGTFDLPVRFDTDNLQLAITTKNVITVPSVPIVELKL